MIPQDEKLGRFLWEEFRCYVETLDENVSMLFPSWLDPAEKWSKRVSDLERRQ